MTRKHDELLNVISERGKEAAARREQRAHLSAAWNDCVLPVVRAVIAADQKAYNEAGLSEQLAMEGSTLGVGDTKLVHRLNIRYQANGNTRVYPLTLSTDGVVTLMTATRLTLDGREDEFSTHVEAFNQDWFEDILAAALLEGQELIGASD